MGKIITNKKRNIMLFLILCSCLGLFGCTGMYNSNNSSVTKKPVEVNVEKNNALTSPTIYDSQDTAIFLGIDAENKTARFQNVSTGKRYTLNYSGVTKVLDRYNQIIAFSQMKTGIITTVRFYKDTKNLVYVSEDTDCIVHRELSSYNLDLDNATIQIYGQLYKFNKNLTVMSGNKEITLSDLESGDVISVCGYNDQIYCISVDKGHGFLTFSNDTYFIGGWVEVGEKVIKKITEDMKLAVPEGTYTVSIIQGSTSGNQSITFNRGETVNWDLSSIEIVTPKTGKVIFTITPTSARVYIDGNEVDTSLPVEEDYGIHQITVIAKGYETLSKYMKVGSGFANISIDLEKQDGEDETEEELEKDVEKDSEDEAEEISSGYKVYIDKPEGAEVYVDGNYIGISPTSFAKKSGSIVLTLRQSGYQTRSYSLEIDDEKKDISYSFSDLEKNE